MAWQEYHLTKNQKFRNFINKIKDEFLLSSKELGIDNTFDVEDYFFLTNRIGVVKCNVINKLWQELDIEFYVNVDADEAYIFSQSIILKNGTA